MRSLRSSYQSFLYITRIRKFVFELRKLRNVTRKQRSDSKLLTQEQGLLTTMLLNSYLMTTRKPRAAHASSSLQVLTLKRTRAVKHDLFAPWWLVGNFKCRKYQRCHGFAAL